MKCVREGGKGLLIQEINEWLSGPAPKGSVGPDASWGLFDLDFSWCWLDDQ
jgi:hypothetical protein